MSAGPNSSDSPILSSRCTLIITETTKCSVVIPITGAGVTGEIGQWLIGEVRKVIFHATFGALWSSKALNQVVTPLILEAFAYRMGHSQWWKQDIMTMRMNMSGVSLKF